MPPPGFCCLPAGYLFWGSKFFPLGPQNRRHVRSSRHVLIERKAKSNAGGLHLLLANNYVARHHSRYSTSTAPTAKLIVARSFCVKAESREQAHACISLRFSKGVVRVDQRESPSLESKPMLASRFDFPRASFAQRDLAPQDRAPIMHTFCSFVEIIYVQNNLACYGLGMLS